MENADPKIEGQSAPSEKDVASANVKVDAGEKKEEKPSNWYDTLPDTYKSDPNITKFKSVEDLSKSYIEVQKLVGKDKVVIPTDKSTKEEIDTFYSKLGRPETADKYEIPNVEIPEELKDLHESSLKVFKDKAYSIGLTKKQFAELAGASIEMQQNTMNQILEKQLQGKQTTATELRGELGAEFDVKQDLANKVVKTFFGNDPETVKIINNHLLSNKGFALGMMKIGESLSEDKLSGEKAVPSMTREQASAEYNKIIADPRLYKEFDPEQPALKARSLELLQMMEAK